MRCSRGGHSSLPIRREFHPYSLRVWLFQPRHIFLVDFNTKAAAGAPVLRLEAIVAPVTGYADSIFRRESGRLGSRKGPEDRRAWFFACRLPSHLNEDGT